MLPTALDPAELAAKVQELWAANERLRYLSRCDHARRQDAERQLSVALYKLDQVGVTRSVGMSNSVTASSNPTVAIGRPPKCPNCGTPLPRKPNPALPNESGRVPLHDNDGDIST